MTVEASDNQENTDTVQPGRAARGDAYLAWWLVIAGLIGLFIFVLKDREAFPNASLDLKVPRSEILKISQEWSSKLGYDPKDCVTSTSFDWDNNAKTFLEYELGAARANDLMKDEVPVWYWRSRFCREYQLQEVQVRLSPAGQLVAFGRKLENDLALPDISHEQAQELAFNFIEKTAQVSLQGCKLVNDEAISRAGRTDHSFTWEPSTGDLNGAKVRVSARVSGNMVSAYNRFLHVPESWQNKFKTIRTYNTLLGQIASVFYYILNFLLVFYFFKAVAAHNIRWKLVLAIGAVFAVGTILAQLNNAPQIFEDYNTNQSVKAFLIGRVAQTGLGALGILLVSACFLGSAEAFYRANYPKRIAVENYFRFKGVATRDYAIGIWAGFFLCALSLGWVVSYYLFGERVGFWCPLGITNYEVLSAACPFYSAICLGVFASLTEETLYRLFALTLAQRAVDKILGARALAETNGSSAQPLGAPALAGTTHAKRALRPFTDFWIANLFQAAAWGFMHSTYPQQPAYARGVELTCGGLVYGWIMKRYGILPCLVSHYLFDAFLDSQALLRSSIPSLQFSALIPVVPLMVLAIGATFYAWRRPAPVDAALNEAIPRPVPQASVHLPHEALPPFDYQPLSKTRRLILVVAILIALPLGLFLRSAPAVGDGFQVRINRNQALVRAREIMSSHGHPAADYMDCAWLDDQISELEMQYAFEKVGLPRTLELTSQTQTGLMWRVRFFKPNTVDEYEVQMDGQGREVSFDITKAEDEPAKHISADDARKMSDDYIARVAPRIHDQKFDHVSAQEKPARVDYTVSYKVPELTVGDAQFKTSTSVLGDEVSNYGDGWDLPDKWKWERSKKTPRDEICGQLKQLVTLVIGLASLWWVFGVLRTGIVRWRPALLLAIPVALLNIPVEINDLPTLFRSYQTVKPLTSFTTEQLIFLLTGMMSKFVEILVTGAFALAAFRLLFPNSNLKSLVKTTLRPDPHERVARRNIWLDAVAAAYALVLCDWLIDCAGFALQAHFSPAVPTKYLTNVCSNANVYSGAVDYLCNGLSRGVRDVIQVGLVAGVYAKYIAAPWIFFLFCAVQSIVQSSDQRYWQDVIVQSVTGFLSVTLYWVFVMRFARKNVLAYFLAGFVALLFRKIPYLVEHTLPCYGLDLVSIMVLVLLPVAYLLKLLIGRRDEANSPIDESADNG